MVADMECIVQFVRGEIAVEIDRYHISQRADAIQHARDLRKVLQRSASEPTFVRVVDTEGALVYRSRAYCKEAN